MENKEDHKIRLAQGSCLIALVIASQIGLYFLGKYDGYLGTKPINVEVRNIDGDQYEDIVLRNKEGKIVNILYGTKKGNFEDKTLVYKKKIIRLWKEYGEERQSFVQSLLNRYEGKKSKLEEEIAKLEEEKENNLEGLR